MHFCTSVDFFSSSVAHKEGEESYSLARITLGSIKVKRNHRSTVLFTSNTVIIIEAESLLTVNPP